MRGDQGWRDLGNGVLVHPRRQMAISPLSSDPEWVELRPLNAKGHPDLRGRSCIESPRDFAVSLVESVPRPILEALRDYVGRFPGWTALRCAVGFGGLNCMTRRLGASGEEGRLTIHIPEETRAALAERGRPGLDVWGLLDREGVDRLLRGGTSGLHEVVALRLDPAADA
jgi:hypothetical protein